MPIEHVDAEIQIGYLESLLQEPKCIVGEHVGAHHRQIEIGIVLCSRSDAGAESTDLILRYVLTQDFPDLLKKVREESIIPSFQGSQKSSGVGCERVGNLVDPLRNRRLVDVGCHVSRLVIPHPLFDVSNQAVLRCQAKKLTTGYAIGSRHTNVRFQPALDKLPTKLVK